MSTLHTAARPTRAKTTPASTPGSFAAHAHGASDVLLDDIEDSAALSVPGEDYDLMKQRMDEALASAKHWSRSYDLSGKQGSVVDADDVAQEAMVAVIMATRGGKSVDKGYAHTATRKIVANAASNITRHEDRKALAMFLERANARSESLGRVLTTAERDEIAAEIREGWHDPRHRPTVDFHTNRRSFVSMDALTDDQHDSGQRAASLDSFAMRNGLTDSLTDGAVDAEGVYQAQALDAIDPAVGHNAASTARRLAWNALAEASDAPMVEEGCMSQTEAGKVRAAMSAYPGGVRAAVMTWHRGIDDAGTQALFAPWPGASIEERDAIAEHLSRHDGYAEDLWTSAVSLADMRLAVRAFERNRAAQA